MPSLGIYGGNLIRAGSTGYGGGQRPDPYSIYSGILAQGAIGLAGKKQERQYGLDVRSMEARERQLESIIDNLKWQQGQAETTAEFGRGQFFYPNVDVAGQQSFIDKFSPVPMRAGGGATGLRGGGRGGGGGGSDGLNPIEQLISFKKAFPWAGLPGAQFTPQGRTMKYLGEATSEYAKTQRRDLEGIRLRGFA